MLYVYWDEVKRIRIESKEVSWAIVEESFVLYTPQSSPRAWLHDQGKECSWKVCAQLYFGIAQRALFLSGYFFSFIWNSLCLSFSLIVLTYIVCVCVDNSHCRFTTHLGCLLFPILLPLSFSSLGWVDLHLRGIYSASRLDENPRSIVSLLWTDRTIHLVIVLTDDLTILYSRHVSISRLCIYSALCIPYTIYMYTPYLQWEVLQCENNMRMRAVHAIFIFLYSSFYMTMD